jgi:O-antigen ligase
VASEARTFPPTPAAATRPRAFNARRALAGEPRIIPGSWWTFWFFVGADPGFSVLMRHSLKLHEAFTIGVYAVLAGWVLLASGRLFSFRMTGVSLLVLLINAVSVASIVFSPVTFQSVPRIYGTMVEWLGISIIVLTLAREESNQALFRQMGTAYVLGTVVAVLSPLYVYHLHFLDVRYGLVALDPNSVGFRAAFALMLVLGGEIGRPANQARGWLVMLFAATLILSFSKTAIVGAVAGFGALWFLSGRRIEHGIKFRQFVAMLIPLVFFWGRLVANAMAYLNNTEEFSTLTGRTVLWQVTLDLSSAHPWLGYGFQTFQEVVDPFFHGNPQFVHAWNTQIVHAHNAYLTALLQIGYVGAALFALLTVTIIWQLVRLVRRPREPSVPVWTALVLIFLIRSVTEGTFAASGPEFAMFCTLGLIGEQLLAQGRMPNSADALRPAGQRLAAGYRWAR